MLWISIAMFLLVLWLVFAISNWDDDWTYRIGIAAIICLIVVGITIIIGTGAVIHYQVKLVETERGLEVAKKQYKTQLATITSLASQYPIEEELLRDLKPEILLNLPEIKSDTFLIAQIELALKYKDNIYKFQYREIGYRRCLDFHQYRWFSCTLASPKY